jgi:hypothetical protein
MPKGRRPFYLENPKIKTVDTLNRRVLIHQKMPLSFSKMVIPNPSSWDYGHKPLYLTQKSF